MQKVISPLKEIKLVGITTRTNNAEISKGDPTTNKISATIQKYFHEGFDKKIPERKKPGTTFCAYTNYESDFTGDYTYFIGEEVISFKGIDKNFETLTIPSQTYIKFTSSPGAMPSVCIDMWKSIWEMTPSDLGEERSYIADFEIYDSRSYDPQNTILDIFIGIKN